MVFLNRWRKLLYVLGGIVCLLMALFIAREFIIPVKYNYDHYTNLQYDYGNLNGPKVGSRAVEFAAQDLDGNIVKLSDFRGTPVVLTTGSGTCPMYTTSNDGMNELLDKYKGEAQFIMLYVREAHPGDRFTAHKTFQQKLDQARQTKSAENERQLVLVDGLQGEIHRSYGAWPNMAYIIDGEGVVRARFKWADPSAVDQALSLILKGKTANDVRYTMQEPSSEDIAAAFGRAGEGAALDFALSAPGLPFHTFEEYYTK